MHNIPLFDSLTHPTVNANWIGERNKGLNSIELLLNQMAENNVRWAFAVGMDKIGCYDVNKYSGFIREKADNLYPVAYFDFNVISERNGLDEFLKGVLEKGYVGIKIHPRFSNINFKNVYLEKIINKADKLGLFTMLCTYYYDTREDSYLNNNLNLIKLLAKVKDARIILLHAGTVRLLEMMEIVHVFKNTLLDLSFTLCRYEGSSLDLDIRYLFENFSTRICVGSDNPEYSLKKFRERFDLFSYGIEKEKVENIAYKNILRFTGLGV